MSRADKEILESRKLVIKKLKHGIEHYDKHGSEEQLSLALKAVGRTEGYSIYVIEETFYVGEKMYALEHMKILGEEGFIIRVFYKGSLAIGINYNEEMLWTEEERDEIYTRYYDKLEVKRNRYSD